jgi:hypothetical protein
MSDLSSSAPGKAATAKQPVSPARNIIGLVVLVAVVAVGWLQYTARAGYNAAVTALDERLKDEDHGLPSQTDAEKLIDKQPDDAGSAVQEGGATYTMKTYTWRGLLKSYTLTAYYTKQGEPALHHIKTEGASEETTAASEQPAAGATPVPPSGIPSPDPTKRLEAGKGKADMKAAPADHPKADEAPKAGADDKAKAPAPKAGAEDKAKAPAPKAEGKPGAGAEKAKAPAPKADEPPKAGADEKAKAPAKEG